MGDRGNIVVRDREGKDVVFYAHWSGHGLAAVVRRALAKEWRWSDDNYLARIIFCEMVKGFEGDETGFGIGRFTAGDRGHAVVLVDVDRQCVFFCDEFEVDTSIDSEVKGYPFEVYAKMTDDEATALFDACDEDEEES